MFEATISGLVIAAASGITVLAYKHPHAFNALFKPMQVFMAVALFIATAWDAGISRAYVKIMPILDSEDYSAAEAAIDEVSLPMMWVILGYLAINLYLSFLWVLPNLIEERSKTSDDNE